VGINQRKSRRKKLRGIRTLEAGMRKESLVGRAGSRRGES